MLRVLICTDTPKPAVIPITPIPSPPFDLYDRGCAYAK